jgi:hypothetical protein
LGGLVNDELIISDVGCAPELVHAEAPAKRKCTDLSVTGASGNMPVIGDGGMLLRGNEGAKLG